MMSDQVWLMFDNSASISWKKDTDMKCTYMCYSQYARHFIHA